MASVDGQFQCAGDSNCSIYSNLTTVNVNGRAAAGVPGILSFLPSPTVLGSDPVNQRTNYATITNVSNGKYEFCSAQANKAAYEDLLPGIMKGDYKPSGQGKILEYGAHYAIDAAGASTALKYSLRQAYGVPMSVTAKWLGRTSNLLLLYSAYSAMKAMQDEMKACMAD